MATGCRQLSDTETQEVLDSFQGKHAKRNRCLFLMGIRCGFRVSEILSLSVGAVWQFDSVVERVSVERSHMKGRQAGRTVLLHAQAKQAIAELIEELKKRSTFGPKMFLFQSQKGTNKPLSRVAAWLMLKKIFNEKKFQGKTGTHSMRKFFCNKLFSKLKDPYKTMQGTGHKSMSSLMCYLDYNRVEIDQAILSI